ncbi:MAG: helix-turn-helix domain-containing protein [Nitrospirae bacterium]|nr:helix-turn-helix domain-containing protein [Nitrospirota bacterium]
MSSSAEDYNEYFRVLELCSDASFSDVRNSYLHLKALYSGDSIATANIPDEFPEGTRQNILGQIEDAYSKLVGFFEKRGRESGCKDRPAITFDDEFKEYLAGMTSFNGPLLRQIREKLGIKLSDIASYTRIRKQYFEEIELEKFSSFPAEVYLRGYLTEYAGYLSLDVSRVVSDYMNRYRLLTGK